MRTLLPSIIGMVTQENTFLLWGGVYPGMLEQYSGDCFSIAGSLLMMLMLLRMSTYFPFSDFLSIALLCFASLCFAFPCFVLPSGNQRLIFYLLGTSPIMFWIKNENFHLFLILVFVAKILKLLWVLLIQILCYQNFTGLKGGLSGRGKICIILYVNSVQGKSVLSWNILW